VQLVQLDPGAHRDGDNYLNWFREERASDDDVRFKLLYEHSTALKGLDKSLIHNSYASVRNSLAQYNKNRFKTHRDNIAILTVVVAQKNRFVRARRLQNML
jgi:hypothetical protein